MLINKTMSQNNVNLGKIALTLVSLKIPYQQETKGYDDEIASLLRADEKHLPIMMG